MRMGSSSRRSRVVSSHDGERGSAGRCSLGTCGSLSIVPRVRCAIPLRPVSGLSGSPFARSGRCRPERRKEHLIPRWRRSLSVTGGKRRAVRLSASAPARKARCPSRVEAARSQPLGQSHRHCDQPVTVGQTRSSAPRSRAQLLLPHRRKPRRKPRS